MIQIREDDSRSKNVVMYGLDVDASEPNDVEAVKKQAATIIYEIESGRPRKYEMPDLKQITILGMRKPGKAPPVLVSMTNENEAKAVLMGKAKKLRTKLKRQYRNVYNKKPFGTNSKAKLRNFQVSTGLSETELSSDFERGARL